MKTMAKLFDEWYEAREDELIIMEPEDIALIAWNDGFVSARQNVDRTACTCAGQEGVNGCEICTTSTATNANCLTPS